MKFFGKFICNTCCYIIYKTFNTDDRHFDKSSELRLNCPKCKRPLNYIQPDFLPICRVLCNKGYSVQMLINSTAGIVFKPRIPDIENSPYYDIPSGFKYSYDADENCNVIECSSLNDSINRFDRIEFRNKAFTGLLNWVRLLPSIRDTEIDASIDLDVTEGDKQ